MGSGKTPVAPKMGNANSVTNQGVWWGDNAGSVVPNTDPPGLGRPAVAGSARRAVGRAAPALRGRPAGGTSGAPPGPGSQTPGGHEGRVSTAPP